MTNLTMSGLLKSAVVVLISIMTVHGAACAQAAPDSNQIDSGVAAFRSGDFSASWRLLKPIAAVGDLKAQRYVALMLLSDEPPHDADGEIGSGVQLLAAAARAGDYVSLIKLEQMRREGHRDALQLSEIIDIEKVRAERGDPVTAWRLANRYETGEGVEVSRTETTKWLSVVAATDAETFPKSREAAFRLCELRAVEGETGSGEAKKWCARAAARGHAGAAIMLRRIAQLEK